MPVARRGPVGRARQRPGIAFAAITTGARPRLPRTVTVSPTEPPDSVSPPALPDSVTGPCWRSPVTRTRPADPLITSWPWPMSPRQEAPVPPTVTGPAAALARSGPMIVDPQICTERARVAVTAPVITEALTCSPARGRTRTGPNWVARSRQSTPEPGHQDTVMRSGHRLGAVAAPPRRGRGASPGRGRARYPRPEQAQRHHHRGQAREDPPAHAAAGRGRPSGPRRPGPRGPLAGFP